MVRIVIGLVVCISLFVSGCASPASGISPIFTASSVYADWDCGQIESEFDALRSEVSSLETQQEKIYKSDKMYGWIGGLFLWPQEYWFRRRYYRFQHGTPLQHSAMADAL